MADVTDRTSAASEGTYLRLIRTWPLRPIRGDVELGQAIDVVNALVDADDLDEEGRDYLDVLSDLVEKYESAQHPMPAVSDADMLRHLIEARGVNQTDTAEATGIADSTISEVLSGRRKLNRAHIEALAKFFKVGPAVFMGP